MNADEVADFEDRETPRKLATCVHPCRVGSHFLPTRLANKTTLLGLLSISKWFVFIVNPPPYRISKLRQLTDYHTIDATSGTHCSGPELNVTQAGNGITQ
jgi:hypothetical protein